MLDENRERLEALISRVSRRDDYGTLLMQGEVVRSIDHLDDPEAWRAGLRAEGSKDGLRIITRRTAGIIYARVTRPRGSDSKNSRLITSALNAAHRAQALGHDPVFVADGYERAALCQNCKMDGYINAAEEVMDGDIFELNCQL